MNTAFSPYFRLPQDNSTKSISQDISTKNINIFMVLEVVKSSPERVNFISF